MSILTKYKEAKNKLLSKFYYTPNNKDLINNFTNASTSANDEESIKTIINNKYYGEKINFFSKIFILSLISYFSASLIISFSNLLNPTMSRYVISSITCLIILTPYIGLFYINKFFIKKYYFFKFNKKLKSTISIEDLFNELLVNLYISNSQKDELKLLFKNALTRNDFILYATKNHDLNFSLLKSFNLQSINLLNPAMMNYVFRLFDQIITNYDNGQFIEHIDDFSLKKISTNQNNNTSQNNNNNNLIPVKDNFTIDNSSNPELWTKIISLHNEIKLKITNNNIDINYFSIDDDKYIESNLELLKLFEYNYSITSNNLTKELLKNQLLNNLNDFYNFLDLKINSINSFLIKEIKINSKTVSCLN